MKRGITWDGVNPFLASLQTLSSTCAGVIFNHEGGDLLYGKADLLIPLPPECIRPIFKIKIMKLKRIGKRRKRIERKVERKVERELEKEEIWKRRKVKMKILKVFFVLFIYGIIQ